MNYIFIYCVHDVENYLMVFSLEEGKSYSDLPEDVRSKFSEITKIEYLKREKIQAIKMTAQNMIFVKFPLWRQINYMSDLLTSKATISSIMSIPYETVMINAFSKITVSSLSDLKTFRENIGTMDLSSLLVDCPSGQVDVVTEGYKKILTALVAEKLIEFARVWSDDKEAYTNAQNYTTELEYVGIDISDCPIL